MTLNNFSQGQQSDDTESETQNDETFSNNTSDGHSSFDDNTSVDWV